MLLCFLLSQKYKQTDVYGYFWVGLALRLFGGVMLYIYQRYIYGWGDMFVYYQGIKEYHQALYEYPLDWLQSLTKVGGEYSAAMQKICVDEVHLTSEEALTIQFGSILGITSFDSFTSTSLWFSLFSYFGSWRLYFVFRDRYPTMNKTLAIPFLFIPSCFFWGTCITKDAIALGAFGLFFHSFYFLFFKRRFRIGTLFWLVLSTYLVAVIKGYILVLFFPALFFLIFFNAFGQIKSRMLKFFSLPIIFLLILLTINFGYNYLSNSEVFNQYVNEQTTEKIKGQYQYLAKQTEARSSYDLGEFEPTIPGILSIVPKSIIITLYRPYLFEINSPPLLLAGIESLIALLLTLYVVFKVGLFKFIRALFSDNYLLFCLIFILSYSSIVGITSGNFGSLMRYKIPIMPYYFTILSVIYYTQKIKSKPAQAVIAEE